MRLRRGGKLLHNFSFELERGQMEEWMIGRGCLRVHRFHLSCSSRLASSRAAQKRKQWLRLKYFSFHLKSERIIAYD